MLGWGKTGRVRASATASSARSRDMYQGYAVALYRQALLTRDDPAAAGHVAGDVVASKYALAPGPERVRASRVPGIRQRDIAVLVRTVLRKRTTSPAAAVADGDQAGGAAAGRR